MLGNGVSLSEPDERRVLLRVLFVSRAYFPATKYGGPVTSLRRVSRLVSQAGHHVMVVCWDMASPGRHGERLRPGTFVVDGVRVRYLRTQFRYHWEGIGLEALRVVPELVADSEVVHVAGSRHFLGILAERAARTCNRPYFIMPEGSVPPRSRNIPVKRAWDAAYARRSLAHAAGVVATSDAEAGELREWGVPFEKLLILPPRADRIEPSREDPIMLRQKWGLPKDAPILLWIGRIHPEKGLAILLEALGAPSLNGIQLLLAGPEEDRQLARQLRETASREPLKGRVRFLGWVDQAHKAELFRLADLFVFPSRKENFGLAAAEAVAGGLPVVLTDGCGLAPVIDGLAGIACEYDARSIAGAISRTLSDPQLLRRLKAGAVEAAQRLDWPPVAAHLEAAYRRAQAEQYLRSRPL